MGTIYEERLKKVRAAMRAEGIDALLTASSSDLFYLLGMRGHLYERLSCVVIMADEAHFIAPVFEIGNYPQASLSLLSVHGWSDGEDPFALADSLLPAGVRRMAVCTAVPSWILLGLQRLRPAWDYVSAELLMRSLRMVKDEEEYRLLKLAQERSCRALMRLLEDGVTGRTELELGRRLMQYSEEEGIGSPDGIPIVAVGPNSALPHHVTDDTVVKKGDVLLFDFGGDNIDAGYIADTTRTFAVGRMPDGLQEIYDIVNAANQAAFEAAKPGNRCCDVDAAARAVITEAGYGEYFTHRLGHGIGLDVHEHPYMSSDNTQLIQAGNAFSDEPGIYLPGRFGVRIEDQLFVREDGAERLTPLDHKLRVID